ncbi:MAG TPA: hypothetical protein VNE82_10680 [Candidatus Binataceae bacterium]|nr:hypothetical protein [Candidatus Binataceae bacterium]
MAKQPIDRKGVRVLEGGRVAKDRRERVDEERRRHGLPPLPSREEILKVAHEVHAAAERKAAAAAEREESEAAAENAKAAPRFVFNFYGPTTILLGK